MHMLSMYDIDANHASSLWRAKQTNQQKKEKRERKQLVFNEAAWRFDMKIVIFLYYSCLKVGTHASCTVEITMIPLKNKTNDDC